MTKSLVTSVPSKPHNKENIALKAAMNILKKWSCSEEEEKAILGVSHSTLYKYKKDPFSARVDGTLMERVSYLLNIHQCLRILFENEKNIYGFVRMPNDNYYFNGATPMDIMKKGFVANLYEVFRQLDSLRGGQW